VSLTGLNTFEVDILGFKNPYSTTAVASAFDITLKTDAGVTRASGGNGVNLIGY